MQLNTGARLNAPLQITALRWRVVAARPDEGRALLAPYAAREAVEGRLDDVFGHFGWSFTLSPLGSAAVVATLSLPGASRSEVVAAGDALPGVTGAISLSELAAFALARTAQRFGIGLAVADSDEDYWVDFDFEAGQPLYEPDPVLVPQSGEAQPLTLPGAEAESSEVEGPEAQMDVAVGGSDGASGGGNAAHAVIERLIDRLKAEGMGKQAARLVVQYGGYGRSPEDSRELYGKLRSLLLNAEVAAP